MLASVVRGCITQLAPWTLDAGRDGWPELLGRPGDGHLLIIKPRLVCIC